MYELIWHGKELIRRVYGATSSLEYEQSVIEAQSDPRYDDIYDVISDFRDCTSCALVENAMEVVAVRDYGAAISNPRIRIAVVAADPEIAAQLRKALGNYRTVGLDHRPATIVDSMEAARAWLRDHPAPRGVR